MMPRKSKTEIYLETFTLDWELDAEFWYGDDYYGYYSDEDPWYCGCPSCAPIWSEKGRVYTTHLSKRRHRIDIEERLVGAFVDMDSIYEMGTVYYRERMLAKLLGDEKSPEELATKIGDYFPLKKR